MRDSLQLSWSRLWRVTARSVGVGAVGGLVGGGLTFFFFGFIGFTGAPFTWRIENGWRALLDPGLEKGLAVGAAIAIVLIVIVVIWTLLARGFNPGVARPWLSGLSAAVVVLYNLEALRTPRGWDWAGIATVLGMGLVVGGIVWAVSPWVLRDWRVAPAEV